MQTDLAEHDAASRRSPWGDAPLRRRWRREAGSAPGSGGLLATGAFGKPAGFTLLENLIALVVLSVGALGSVALQLNALQATHSAYQRSLASLIAADVGERLWAGMANGQVDIAWLPELVQRRDCGASDAHVCLPELEVRIGGAAERRVISVSWAESRFQDAEGGRVVFDYVIDLLPGQAP